MTRLRDMCVILVIAALGLPSAATAAAPSRDEAQARQRAVSFWAEARRAPSSEETLRPLRAGDFEALNAWAEAAQKDYEEGRSGEYRVFQVFAAFEVAGLLPALDRWVAARPDAWPALAARGVHRTQLGWWARGTGLAKDLSVEQRRAMQEHFAGAEQDLRAALALRPRLLPASARLIEIAMARGDHSSARAALDQALRLDPASYHVRRPYMESLVPEWGGSWDAMDAFARESQVHATENPNLIALLGFSFASRGLAQWRVGNQQAAVELYSAALGYARRTEWLRQRASAYELLRDCPRAIADLDEAREYESDKADSLITRGHCRESDGDRDGALASFAEAAQRAPDYAYAAGQYARALERAGRYDAAAAEYRRFLGAHPDEAWALRGLGILLLMNARRPAEARPVLAHWVEIEPKRAEAWRNYGDALHDLGDPTARSALARYLALVDPNDPAEREFAARVRTFLASQPGPAAVVP